MATLGDLEQDYKLHSYRLHNFKIELVKLCEKYNLLLSGDGWSEITISTYHEDEKKQIELETFVSEISPKGIKR